MKKLWKYFDVRRWFFTVGQTKKHTTKIKCLPLAKNTRQSLILLWADLQSHDIYLIRRATAFCREFSLYRARQNGFPWAREKTHTKSRVHCKLRFSHPENLPATEMSPESGPKQKPWLIVWCLADRVNTMQQTYFLSAIMKRKVKRRNFDRVYSREERNIWKILVYFQLQNWLACK
jgi:hypothetical protein